MVSFFIGAALIAALIDIPLFARTTVYPDSQLQAALVLVRFLVALPVGAVIGGYLTRRLPAGVVTAAGMVLAAVGFLLMSRWGAHQPGAGIGQHRARRRRLRLRPGPGAGQRGRPGHDRRRRARAQHRARRRGRRMVGMLVGISALTTLGLRSYYAEQGDVPPARRGLRRQEPVHGVHAAAQGGGDRPGADGLPGRRGLRLVAGDPRAPALPHAATGVSRAGDLLAWPLAADVPAHPLACRVRGRHDFDDLLAANRDYAAAFDAAATSTA